MLAADETAWDCENIGATERAYRMRVFYQGTVMTVVAVAAMVFWHASWAVRLLTAFPAGVAAFGYFQARAHVCVAFAAANIKVLGDSRQDRINVVDEDERQKIRRAARRVYVQGIATALAVTALVQLLP